MTANNIAGLRTLNGSSGPNLTLLGYYNPGDLGGGEFYWDASSTSGENGGTIIVNTAGTGRWIRVLNSGRINVRWFGARGDGSTDDTARIQAAINYCGTNGYCLYIPMGTYIVASVSSSQTCLKVSYNNLCIEGDGEVSEIKVKNSNRNPSILLIESATPASTQIKNVTVKNIRLNGNKANQSGAYINYCIVVNVSNIIADPANIVLDGLYCHSAFSGQLPIEGGGINLRGTDQSYIVRDAPPQNILVTNCFCWDNGGWGIGTNWSVSSFTISNNICWDNATMGITVWNSQDGLISNNICYNNSSYGINVEGSERININANNITSTGSGGVQIYNSMDILANSNIIRFATDYYDSSALNVISGNGWNGGSFKRRPSSGVKISDNTITCNGSEGFCLKTYSLSGGYDYCFDIDIESNRITNNNIWKGLSAYCNNLIVSNNNIKGFVYLVATSGYLIIQNNKLSYDNLSGIGFSVQVDQCENLIFKNNLLKCVSNGDSALYIGALSIAGIVQISNNSCDGDYNQFVRLNSSSVIPLFSNNVILRTSVNYLNTIPAYPPTSGNWGVNTYLENPNPTVSASKMTVGWKKLPTGSWVQDVSSTV